MEIIKIIVSALVGAFLAHFFNQRRENKIKNYEARNHLLTPRATQSQL